MDCHVLRELRRDTLCKDCETRQPISCLNPNTRSYAASIYRIASIDVGCSDFLMDGD
jgi:hypothetical protein